MSYERISMGNRWRTGFEISAAGEKYPSETVDNPEKISGYKNIVLDAANVKAENITNPEYLTDNFVPEHYNLPVESSREATLGSGLSYVEIDFDKEYLIGRYGAIPIFGIDDVDEEKGE